MKKTNQGNNNSSNRTFLKKVLLFVILFIVVDTIITRPLRKKLEQAQKEKVEILNNINETKKEEKKILETEINTTEAKIVTLENDFIKLTLNTKGLQLNNLVLKKYKENISDKTLVKLLQHENDDNFNFIDINWLSYSGNIKLPTKNSIWTANKDKIEKIGERVVFSYDNGEGIIFRIILSLDEKYMINVEQLVENKTNNRIFLKPVWQIQRKQAKQDRNELVSFNGILGVFNNKIEEIKDKKLKNKNIEFQKFNWAGITSKYWLTAFINQELSNGTINLLKNNNILKIQYTTKNNLVILENSFAGTRGKIFVGAKDFDILREYQINENITLFDRSIDFGFFYFLSKPLFLLLNFINRITHNFGIAIILLTLMLKILLYPSIKKSFISMVKMKKIQPEMKYLQEKYKDNKILLQQELAQLYKKHKLNPLASITPLLIQIPVFFSLYKVISISLNMRQAPFFGYIKDLSIGDPTTIFNLFGLLPFNPKITIGLLPCIMGLSMYIQQKVTESMQGNDNKAVGNSVMEEQMKSMNNMMKFMPILFVFLFAGFPAGLLIYWILNNIISIIQQIYIGKKMKNNV